MAHWNRTTVEHAASECETRSDFHARYPGAYKHAQRAGYLNEITALMRGYGRRRLPDYWTAERIRAVAARYSTKTAFATEQSGAYAAARELGIYAEITAHMAESKRHTRRL